MALRTHSFGTVGSDKREVPWGNPAELGGHVGAEDSLLSRGSGTTVKSSSHSVSQHMEGVLGVSLALFYPSSLSNLGVKLASCDIHLTLQLPCRALLSV